MDSQRSHHVNARWVAILVVVAVTASGIGNPAIRASRVEAQVGSDLPSPYAFALPASVFPAGAVARGSRATQRMLEAASGLHTVPLSQHGHLEGYLQSAQWSLSGRNGDAGAVATLQYMASIFATPQGADAAYGDARASLWEIAHPLRRRMANVHPFVVTKRNGNADIYLLLHRGMIGLELRLHYGLPLSMRSFNVNLSYLSQIASAAWQRAVRLARRLPTIPVPAPSALPQIYTSPWGTGPVVKSPSLMVADAAQPGPDAGIDAGAFRSAVPAMAPSAVDHARITPPGALARYVRTATENGGSEWYDATALYGSPQLANQAFLALTHTNRYHSWLSPYPLSPDSWRTGRLSIVDDSRAWTLQSETVFVFRIQNVLLMLSEIGQAPDEMAPLVGEVVARVPTWLHA